VVTTAAGSTRAALTAMMRLRHEWKAKTETAKAKDYPHEEM
jgi:hypothetical protein